MITTTTAQFLAEHPGVKYLFFGGKGGVGKTVMAGTAALWFAQRGRRTLLASTNPVHSLTSQTQPNKALHLTASSVRSAPASGSR